MKTSVGVEVQGDRGKKGTVTYDEEKKKITVDLYHEKRADVVRFMAKRREFFIPESNEDDDYRIDLAYPSEYLTYFELSMNILYAYTNVWVNWREQKWQM